MKTRTAIRLAIPCVCFAAVWIVTHALRPAPAATARMIPVKTTPEQHGSAARPSAAPQEVVAALESAPSGKWQAVWTEFAARATEAELMSVAAGPPGMPRNLAWEELAARRPEALTDLARKFRDTPGFAAAAAVLAERQPGLAEEFIHQIGAGAVIHAVLTTVAWRDPEAARRMAKKLQPDIEEDHDAKRPISAAWTRRDPEAAAAASYEDIGMWARVDAVGALRHVLTQRAEDRARKPELWMLVAALSQSPDAALRLMEAHPALLDLCSEATNKAYGDSLIARWYSVAPESCLAAVQAAAVKAPAQKPWLLALVASINQEAAGALAVRFPEMDMEKLRWKRTWLVPDPQLDFDPVTATENLLAALETHPPAEAMIVAGLSAHQAAKLAVLLAAQLPDKARALAAKVPRETFEADPAAIPFVSPGIMEELWPAAPSLASEAAPAGMSFEGAGAMLQSDPARYAVTVDPSGNDGWAAWNTATNWAPHDFAAATAWVRALPAGVAKQRAEAALAMELAVQNPPAGLAAMAALLDSVWAEFGQDAAAGVWLQAIHHLALSGGDWQHWQAKVPERLKEKVQMLARDALDTDAALLAVLKRAQ